MGDLTEQSLTVIDWCIQAKLTDAHGEFLVANGIEKVPTDLIDAFLHENGDLNKQAIQDFVNQNAEIWKFLHVQLFTKALQKLTIDCHQQQQPDEKTPEPPKLPQIPKPESQPPKENEANFARSVASGQIQSDVLCYHTLQKQPI